MHLFCLDSENGFWRQNVTDIRKKAGQDDPFID